MKSMTAFGRAKAMVNGREITVELRSVNSRYFECSVRISRIFSFLEEKIKPYLQAHGISRGKVDVSISVDVVETDGVEIALDESYLNPYLRALATLRDKYGLRDDVSVMSVASNREIFTVKKPEEDMEADWADLKSVLTPALESFLNARSAEGANIEADLKNKIASINETVSRIETLSINDVSTYKEKLRDRLTQMLADNKITIDENRILTECAIFADKVAIDEELVRLRSHFKAFGEICLSSEPVGRKLDFLIQEMNREINTIGSKCSNSDIAHLVVDVKTEIEKIREQIQNIE